MGKANTWFAVPALLWFNLFLLYTPHQLLLISHFFLLYPSIAYSLSFIYHSLLFYISPSYSLYFTLFSLCTPPSPTLYYTLPSLYLPLLITFTHFAFYICFLVSISFLFFNLLLLVSKVFFVIYITRSALLRLLSISLFFFCTLIPPLSVSVYAITFFFYILPSVILYFSLFLLYPLLLFLSISVFYLLYLSPLLVTVIHIGFSISLLVSLSVFVFFKPPSPTLYYTLSPSLSHSYILLYIILRVSISFFAFFESPSSSLYSTFLKFYIYLSTLSLLLSISLFFFYTPPFPPTLYFSLSLLSISPSSDTHLNILKADVYM
ncbi:unnamed protein product [Acanthosepion pharaonis]|uniref:Uncharacterized protein n=1 Tax=Acanthosepion pharaonis TaxID=158019 RepID=A0A812B5W7_ACAPH|nr:unnamed protein product [Sepia pharaonis]